MGWARRTRTENDRRVVLVEATQKGQRLIETIRDDLDQVNDLGFSSLSDVELTRIEALFDSVLAICLQQYGQDRLDLAQIKQEFRGFANDPIRFLKTHKLTES
jgi:DNA-binding MarR family transcriptional regulator